MALVACGSSGRKMTVGEKANLKDERMTEQHLDLLTNAFADRYYTLMLSASERVMKDNPDLRQRRLMNGLRLLSVSSMYDISTSPDTVSQLVDQVVVVTLQNYLWVDSGKAQAIWGEERAQYLVENLRRMREDVWDTASQVFRADQLELLDMLISDWWVRSGGTEFVAYVRFTDVAAERGRELINTVKDGDGLLEQVDRATEQVRQANMLAQRTFFWAKRLPLFANWQAEALAYDVLIMPETERVLGNLNTLTKTAADLPQTLADKGEMGKQLLTQYRDSIQSTSALVDKLGPLLTSVQGTMKESGEAMTRVNEALRLVQALQAESAKANAGAPPAKPVELAEYGKLLDQLKENLVQANALLSTTETLTDQKKLSERLQPVEHLVQMRIREVQGAADEIVGRLMVSLAVMVGGVLTALFLFHLWRRRKEA
ncbi:MAG: hypothetical protein ACKPEA_16600 [Planctomycetota bacterium]